MFQQLARTRFAVAAGQNAGLSCRIDHPVHGRKRLYIAGHAQIAVHQLHAKPLQRQPVGFAALARQVVQPHDLDALVRLQKAANKMTTRKPAYARDQDFHANTIPAHTPFLFRPPHRHRRHLSQLHCILMSGIARDSEASAAAPREPTLVSQRNTAQHKESEAVSPVQGNNSGMCQGPVQRLPLISMHPFADSFMAAVLTKKIEKWLLSGSQRRWRRQATGC